MISTLSCGFPHVDIRHEIIKFLYELRKVDAFPRIFPRYLAAHNRFSVFVSLTNFSGHGFDKY